MSVVKSGTGWGIIIFGTIIMGVGYVLTKSTNLDVGKTNIMALGGQMEQIGLMLLVGGIIAWVMISVLADLRII